MKDEREWVVSWKGGLERSMKYEGELSDVRMYECRVDSSESTIDGLTDQHKEMSETVGRRDAWLGSRRNKGFGGLSQLRHGPARTLRTRGREEEKREWESKIKEKK